MLRFMIGRLRGIIVEKGPDGALMDVNGVGYDISLPLSTLASLPPTGDVTSLWIHTHVREEELRLFGFSVKGDRTAFRTMLKVSGVGPKVALAVIGALSGDQLARAVNDADTKRLTSIPGIGKKTAERIILELGGKLALGNDGKAVPGTGVLAELSSALMNLGFKSAAVDRVITELDGAGVGERPFEALLRDGLAMLQKKG